VRRALVLLAAFGLAALPALGASAVKPRPKTMYEDHLHNTHGNDWHVQLQVNNAGTALTSIVLWAETCNDSGVAGRVPIHADGTFAVVDAKLAGGKGTWSVQGTFADDDHASGTWSVTKGSCTVADHPFDAHDGLGHYIIGNPDGYAPPRILGRSFDARHLRHFQVLTFANVQRWSTVAKASSLGYVLDQSLACPGLHHARKNGVRMWGKLLDPDAPQSLVYWCDANRNWTLAAAMFRAPRNITPPVFGNMIQWHKHGSTATWMTHVWFVSPPTAAFAACAPFPAFAARGAFTYLPYQSDIPIDEPCPDTDTGQPPESEPAPEPAPAPAP
jgi:hypothetical protein